MAQPTDIYWQRVTGQLGAIAYEVTRVQFAGTLAARWQPAINAYRCQEGFAVCVDLAGVDRAAIKLDIEPRRLRIRGHREAPEPDRTTHEPLQVLAMEIDCGCFQREVVFPADIDISRTSAEQQNGLLWIYLPLRTEA